MATPSVLNQFPLNTRAEPVELEKNAPAGNQELQPSNGSVESRDEKQPYQSSDRDLPAAGLNEVDEFNSGPPNPYMEKFHAFKSSKQATVLRDMILIGALLGWWIPGIINPNTRHMWVITSIWTWFFIFLILLHKSKYIPQKPIVRVLVTGWNAVFGKPWSMLTHNGKLIVGWTAFLVLWLGASFGLPETQTSPYVDRVRSLGGIAIINLGLFATSHRHSAVKAQTTILGLGFQMIIGLFAFRTGAGFSFFSWIATAAADLLHQAEIGGAAFFWNQEFIENHYFFVNTLAAIIFFIALSIALFYLGVLQWFIGKLAWFFYRTMGISGAEAVVAVASPFIGQGENCVLTRPYVNHFTASEIHQVLTSGFATIAGSVFIAYVNLGVPPRNLITSSVMSIPGSIAASKLRVPETGKPLTAGKTAIIDKGEDTDEEQAANLLHAYSLGAWFGLRVAGLIFCNVLVIVSLVYTINGLLEWIGQFWGLGRHYLNLELMGSYILWPLTYLLGVPRGEVLVCSRLLATKIVANEFVAYLDLQTLQAEAATALSPRAYLITSYMLCGFGNISSMGINIGILSALAPKRSAIVVKLAPSALITGILVTCQTAAIAGLISD